MGQEEKCRLSLLSHAPLQRWHGTMTPRHLQTSHRVTPPGTQDTFYILICCGLQSGPLLLIQTCVVCCKWGLIRTKPWHLSLYARWENGKSTKVQFFFFPCALLLKANFKGFGLAMCLTTPFQILEKWHFVHWNNFGQNPGSLSQQYLFVNLWFLFIKNVLAFELCVIDFYIIIYL